MSCGSQQEDYARNNPPPPPPGRPKKTKFSLQLAFSPQSVTWAPWREPINICPLFGFLLQRLSSKTKATVSVEYHKKERKRGSFSSSKKWTKGYFSFSNVLSTIRQSIINSMCPCLVFLFLSLLPIPVATSRASTDHKLQIGVQLQRWNSHPLLPRVLSRAQPTCPQMQLHREVGASGEGVRASALPAAEIIHQQSNQRESWRQLSELICVLSLQPRLSNGGRPFKHLLQDVQTCAGLKPAKRRMGRLSSPVSVDPVCWLTESSARCSSTEWTPVRIQCCVQLPNWVWDQCDRRSGETEDVSGQSNLVGKRSSMHRWEWDIHESLTVKINCWKEIWWFGKKVEGGERWWSLALQKWSTPLSLSLSMSLPFSFSLSLFFLLLNSKQSFAREHVASKCKWKTVSSAMLDHCLPFLYSDINECTRPRRHCEAGYTCNNTPGSFRCDCHASTQFNGTHCVIDDEEISQGKAFSNNSFRWFLMESHTQNLLQLMGVSFQWWGGQWSAFWATSCGFDPRGINEFSHRRPM